MLLIKDLDELNMICLASTEAFWKCSEVYLWQNKMFFILLIKILIYI